MIEEKSCGIIIYKKNTGRIKFLLLRRADKKEEYWELSKGHQEGDSELEAAKRELFEETKIKNIEFIEGFKEMTSYISSSTGNKRIFTFFLGKTDDDIVLSDEHIDFKFFTLEDAKKILPHDDWYDLLLKAEKVV